MSNPDEIRADIEATRAELGSDVDALADKVTPSKIVNRQTDKVRSAVGSVRERVMGVASDAKDKVSSAGSSASGGVSGVGDRVSGAASSAVDQAKGNPLAVGLIAFGVGWLAASLLPASAKEKELGASVKEAAQPLVHEVTDVAKQVGENLREPAQEAAQAVKETATEGADNVRSEAGSAAGEVKDQAQEARQNFSS